MTRALIAGAGIAGPAAAIALHKAGITTAIYEAYPPGTLDAGAFVTIAANGQDALRAIDADGPVHAISFPAPTLRLSDATGTPLGAFPLGHDHPAPRTLTRAALSQALRTQAADRGITLAYGKQLTTAAQTGNTVTAFFADGTSAEADLLIGADGVHSPVRAAIDPAGPAPRHVGLIIACGYTPPAPQVADPGGYHMIYGHHGFFGYTMASDGRIWWFARIPGPELTPADRTAPAARWRDKLASAFADDTSPAAQIISSAGGQITITGAYDIAHLPRWHHHSMVVIGDAAHAASPSTAQGASLAIEDAVILAQCLRDRSTIPRALGTFENTRRERTERIVQSGTSGTNPSPRPPGPRPATTDWLYKHHIDWDTRSHSSTPEVVRASAILHGAADRTREVAAM